MGIRHVTLPWPESSHYYQPGSQYSLCVDKSEIISICIDAWYYEDPSLAYDYLSYRLEELGLAPTTPQYEAFRAMQEQHILVISDHIDHLKRCFPKGVLNFLQENGYYIGDLVIDESSKFLNITFVKG